jgi:hypothetical protein
MNLSLFKLAQWNWKLLVVTYWLIDDARPCGLTLKKTVMEFIPQLAAEKDLQLFEEFGCVYRVAA